MTVNWEFAYIYRSYAVLLGFLAKQFPANNKKGYEMPLDIQFYADPLPAMEQTGETMDEEENGSGLALYDEIEKIDGVEVHKGATVEEMKKLYPEHCTGNLPHAGKK